MRRRGLVVEQRAVGHGKCRSGGRIEVAHEVEDPGFLLRDGGDDAVLFGRAQAESNARGPVFLIGEGVGCVFDQVGENLLEPDLGKQLDGR